VQVNYKYFVDIYKCVCNDFTS